MATPESYRPEERASSPAPELPEDDRPQRFQFSLKQLLAFMFASALLAAALRLVVPWMQSLDVMERSSLVEVTMFGLVFGGLFYVFWRAPYLAVRGGQIYRHWRDIQQHRRDLLAWGEKRRKRGASDSDSPAS